MYSAVRIYKVKFSMRKRGTATVAVYEYKCSDELWHIYETLGLSEAPWIREVDVRNMRIVVFPRRL
jgi:hypothetical protein